MADEYAMRMFAGARRGFHSIFKLLRFRCCEEVRFGLSWNDFFPLYRKTVHYPGTILPHCHMILVITYKLIIFCLIFEINVKIYLTFSIWRQKLKRVVDFIVEYDNDSNAMLRQHI